MAGDDGGKWVENGRELARYGQKNAAGVSGMHGGAPAHAGEVRSPGTIKGPEMGVSMQDQPRCRGLAPVLYVMGALKA